MRAQAIALSDWAPDTSGFIATNPEAFSTPGAFPLSVSGPPRPIFPMKRLLLSLLAASVLGPLAVIAGEKANTVLIHPGETIYAKFTQQGRKLSLVSTSKEKDETAQLIFTMSRAAPGETSSIQVENKFAKDLVYKVEIRSLSLKRQVPLVVVPVVAGKLAREQLPPYIEELAAYAFKLER